MSFPSSPSNGDKYTKDNTDIYTYSSSNNAWTLSGYVSGFGNFYITDGESPIVYGTSSTPFSFGTSYCVNSGNYIYCPVVVYINSGINITMEVISTNESALPLRVRIPSTYGGLSLSSTYLDSGVIYFNLTGSTYIYFTLSNNTWSSTFSGSHTTGTLINTDLILNGFKYQPSLNYFAEPGSMIYYDFIPLCKVTKI